ncbi:hypothetical protein ASE63_13770 [Bosea sp. Root381]|nr:hypothetical protein ASE63_13770 [Bosea sp. Root381]
MLSEGLDRPIRVLLVEDDNDLRAGLADYLRLSGLIVAEASSGIAFYKALRTDRFDVAILDVNLPDTSGFELARDAAEEGNMGVVLLTARAGRDDRVRGYSVGADLYLTKPVDGEELLLAVRNLTRRARTLGPAPSPANPQTPSLPSDSAWKLDAMRQALLPPHGTRLALSGREMLLVEALARAEGTTVSRQKLASELGYADASSESRSLDAVVRRLRQKAQDAGVELPLKAVHAIGFRFAAQLKLL